MRTSVGVFALAGFLAAFTGAASAQEPAWKTSYFEARNHGQQVKKPLAVIVGQGPNGTAQLISEGSLSSDVRKILATEYVPVYLDATKADNQGLIQALGIRLGKGIVLSDRTGDQQAFFHEGSLSQADLLRQLQHFADPAVVVRATATLSSGRISYYPSGQVAPAGYVPSMRSVNC